MKSHVPVLKIVPEEMNEKEGVCDHSVFSVGDNLLTKCEAVRQRVEKRRTIHSELREPQAKRKLHAIGLLAGGHYGEQQC